MGLPVEIVGFFLELAPAEDLVCLDLQATPWGWELDDAFRFDFLVLVSIMAIAEYQ